MKSEHGNTNQEISAELGELEVGGNKNHRRRI